MSKRSHDAMAASSSYTVSPPRMFPWASDRLNMAEVRARLESGLHPFMATGTADVGVCRQWRPLVGDNCDWWDYFVPNEVYMVAAYREKHGSVTAVEASVMRFIAYVKVPEARAAIVDAYVDADRFTTLHKCDGDSDGEYDEDIEAHLYVLRSLRKAAKLYYVFEDLCDDRRRRYRIDLFGGAIPSDTQKRTDVKIDVMRIGSTTWYVRGQDTSLRTPEGKREVQAQHRRMDSIRRGWELGIVADVAARTIQRAWRRARADPAHPVCRKRLRAEFEDMHTV
jgi:hypothetical protein